MRFQCLSTEKYLDRPIACDLVIKIFADFRTFPSHFFINTVKKGDIGILLLQNKRKVIILINIILESYRYLASLGKAAEQSSHRTNANHV
jgi:hypothetical protein